MKTNCERCCAEIEDTEVEHCDICDLDGVCSECLASHDCARTDPDQETA